jgi:hypothetical protein
VAGRTVFRKVLELVKEGKRFEARQLIADELNKHPGNADAWIVMSQLVDDRERAIYYLERALEISPDEERARHYLERLRSKLGRSAHPTSIGVAVPSKTRIHDSGLFDQADEQPVSEPEDDTVELIRVAIKHEEEIEQPAYATPLSVESLDSYEDDTAEHPRPALHRKKVNWIRVGLLPALVITLGLVLIVIGTGGALGIRGSGKSASVEVVYRVNAPADAVVTYQDNTGIVRQSEAGGSMWVRTFSLAPGNPVILSVQAPAGAKATCEIIVNGAVMVSKQSDASGAPVVCDGVLVTR